jgi:hypothetical protein
MSINMSCYQSIRQKILVERFSRIKADYLLTYSFPSFERGRLGKLPYVVLAMRGLASIADMKYGRHNKSLDKCVNLHKVFTWL